MIARMGTMITKASGSLGSLTIANRAGTVVLSNRGRHANQATSAQNLQRCYHTQALAAWRALTSAQRLAWALYAFRRPLSNRVGTSRKLTAPMFFLREAVPRIAAGIAAPTNPPTLGQQGVGTPTGIYWTAGATYTVQWTSPTTDPDGYYLFAVSRPMSETFSRKPYWHVLPGYRIETSETFDLYDAVTARVGIFGIGERYLMRLRYAGDHSLISAYTQFTGTVYAP
jgi:hypothetical protein